MQRHGRRQADPQRRRDQHGAKRPALPVTARHEREDQRRNTQDETDIGNVRTDNIAQRESGAALEGRVQRHDHFRRRGAETDNENTGNQWRHAETVRQRNRPVDQEIPGEGHDNKPPDKGGDQRNVRHCACASLVETLEFDEVQDAEDQHDRADGNQGGMDHDTVSLFSLGSVSFVAPSLARVAAIGEPHSTRYHAQWPTCAPVFSSPMPACADR